MFEIKVAATLYKTLEALSKLFLNLMFKHKFSDTSKCKAVLLLGGLPPKELKV